MSETKPGSAPEINKENKETEPKITVDFFFSYHGTKKDFDSLPEAVKKADVYIPEVVEWTEKEEKLLNAISQGAVKVTPNTRADILAFYNLKIPIVLVDTPKEHPSNEKFSNATGKELDAYSHFLSGDFDQAVEKLKESLPEQASLIIERENFIADKLKEDLGTLTQKFPQLKNKKDIRVLVSLGAVHTSLYKKLKPELPLSKIILGRNTLVFGTLNEIIRRLIRHPQEIVSDDLYAKSLMEDAILNIIGNLTKDNNELTIIIRKLAANLSTEQIRSFSETIGGSSGEMRHDDLRDMAIKKLEEMGVKLPTTEEEIDKLIKLKNK